jgi:hypothetical protein
LASRRDAVKIARHFSAVTEVFRFELGLFVACNEIASQKDQLLPCIREDGLD